MNHALLIPRRRSASRDYVSEWQAAVDDAGGTLTAGDITAVTTWWASAQLHGYATKLLDCGLFVGDFAASLVKFLDWTGSNPTLGNTGFVSGDYVAARGLKGGTGRILDTGFNYQTYGTGVIGHSFFLNDGIPRNAVVSAFMGRSNSLLANHMQMYYGGEGMTGAWNDTFPAVPQAAYASGAGRGLWHYASPTTASFKARYNGTVYASNTTAFSDGTKNTTCKLFGVDATLPYYGSFYAIDDGSMSDAQALSFAQDVLQLQRDLGRVVPLAGPQRYAFTVGQSLGTGMAPILTTSQPYANRLFNQHAGGWFVGPTYLYTTPLAGCPVETHEPGFANLASALWRADHASDASKDLLVGNFAVGGAAYDDIKQGTAVYNFSIAAITEAIALSPDWHSGGVTVPGVICIHGETDYSNATYQDDLEEWQADYETDIKVVTGQAGTIPMFVSQPSNAWGYYVSHALSPFAILQASIDNPTKIYCVCPKYFLPYTDQTPDIHLTNHGYRRLGEYYGKAWDAVVNRGGTWSALRPTSIIRTGAEIVISFAGRVGNLALDDTAVDDPGNYGFEWEQVGGSARTISSVALFNSNTQIKVTLSGDPGSPSTERLHYADQDLFPASVGGGDNGPRGCLRDSDPTASLYAYDLFNWCVHFDYAIGYSE